MAILTKEELMQNPRVNFIQHPLIEHKLSILRDKDTGTHTFRRLAGELATLEAFEATRDLPLEDVSVTTPLETCTCHKIAGKKAVIIPILRAGLGMVDGLLTLMPSARVGHIGMQRNEETHEPEPYYCNLPQDLSERPCFVVDPMLATGGSAIAALDYLRKAGAQDVRMLFLVSAPEGIQKVIEHDKDVVIYTCAIDRELNENAYILPGLGDAGDRIFGTK